VNYCCLDHDDVIWDGSKGGNSGEQGESDDETWSFREE
jgi:hypothetical protein